MSGNPSDDMNTFYLHCDCVIPCMYCVFWTKASGLRKNCSGGPLCFITRELCQINVLYVDLWVFGKIFTAVSLSDLALRLHYSVKPYFANSDVEWVQILVLCPAYTEISQKHSQGRKCQILILCSIIYFCLSKYQFWKACFAPTMGNVALPG